MHKRFRVIAVSVAVGMIPVAIAIYELFLAPATGQGGVVIAPHLWFTLCAFTPALLPLLSSFQGHRWPGDFVFAASLILSNAVIYSICGLAIAFVMKKIFHVDRLGSPHASINP